MKHIICFTEKIDGMNRVIRFMGKRIFRKGEKIENEHKYNFYEIM